MLSHPALHVVLLDELNTALKYHYIDVDDVIAAQQTRPPMQHVVISGCGTPPALVDITDTVTEMVVVKHAFATGIRAQKGINL